MTKMMSMTMTMMPIIILNELKKRVNLHINDVSSGGHVIKMGELVDVALLSAPPANAPPTAAVVEVGCWLVGGIRVAMRFVRDFISWLSYFIV